MVGHAETFQTAYPPMNVMLPSGPTGHAFLFFGMACLLLKMTLYHLSPYGMLASLHSGMMCGDNAVSHGYNISFLVVFTCKP